MARRVLVPDASIRKEDSIACAILGLIADATLKLFLNGGAVLRMNSVKPGRRSRDVVIRLRAVRTRNCRRRPDKVHAQIVPPAFCTTEPLHLKQEGLALPQRLLNRFSVVD